MVINNTPWFSVIIRVLDFRTSGQNQKSLKGHLRV